jgi:hypothetical protein
MVSVCSSDVGNTRLLRLPWLPQSSSPERHAILNRVTCAGTRRLPPILLRGVSGRAAAGGGGQAGCFQRREPEELCGGLSLLCQTRVLGLGHFDAVPMVSCAQRTQAGTSTSPLVHLGGACGWGWQDARKGEQEGQTGLPPRSRRRRELGRADALSLFQPFCLAWGTGMGYTAGLTHRSLRFPTFATHPTRASPPARFPAAIPTATSSLNPLPPTSPRTFFFSLLHTTHASFHFPAVFLPQPSSCRVRRYRSTCPTSLPR